MKIHVNLTPFGKDYNVGKVRNSLASNAPQTISPQEFVDLVGRKNYSFNSCLHIPAENTRSQNNSTAHSWQLLALDFDSKVLITPVEVLEKLEPTLGKPNLIYTTKRNPPHKVTIYDAERYRVIYFLERSILLDQEGRKKRKLVLHFLLNLLPNLDGQAFDEARLFFGGGNVIYENHDSYLPIELLYSLSLTFDIQCKTDKAFKKNLLSRLPQTNKDRKNEEYNNIYINNTVFGRSPIKWSDEQWKLAKDMSPLLANFLEAKIKVEHPELFKLYLAMMQIEGGTLKWRNAVKSNPLIDEVDKINKIHHYISMNKKSQTFYEPTFKSIDPDVSDEFPMYLSQLGKNSKNTVTRIKHEVHVNAREIEDIREDLKLTIKDFFHGEGSFLLKAPTGSSKSTSTIEFLKNNKQFRSGTLIAFPRHNLLQEFGELLSKHKIAFKRILDIPELNSAKLSNEVKQLYKRGFHSSVRYIFRKISEGNQTIITKYDADSDVVAIREFFKNNEIVCKHNGLILATHQALVYRDFPKVKRVIIDENPLDTFLKVHEVDYSAFKKVASENPELNSIFKDVVSEIQNLKEKAHELQFVKVLGLDEIKKEKFSNIEFDNLGYLLDCDTIFPIFDEGKVIKIVVGQLGSLKRYKQLLILSATADYGILSKIVPDLEFKDLGQVNLKGRLIQFLARGYSKSVVSKLVYDDSFKKFAEDLLKVIGNTIIASPSVKDLKDLLEVKFNYHNTSGLNSLSEYDLIVFGTEFPPDYLIPIRAYLLGIPFFTTEMSNFSLYKHGVEFTIRTYKDLTLRQMHIDFMEEILLQTVGRARLPLNKNRKVIVIAKIPLQQAEKFLEKEYDDLVSIIQNCDVTGSNAPDYSTVMSSTKSKPVLSPLNISDEDLKKLILEIGL
jgi:hypothetical protein